MLERKENAENSVWKTKKTTTTPQLKDKRCR